MGLGSLITGERSWGGRPDDPLTLAFGISADYARPMGVALTSALARTRDVDAHVFADAMPPPDDAGRLAATAGRYGARVTWHAIDRAAFAGLPSSDLWTTAIYHRFVAGDFFHGRAARFLYLDADTLCLVDLRALWSTPLGPGRAVAAVRDGKRTADRGKDYFNSGVMLIDPAAWRELEVTDKAIDLLGSGHRYEYPDQDVLNIICAGQVAWLPDACNRLPCAAAATDTAIVHYTGGSKPWTAWFDPAADGGLYARAMADSAWSDVPPVAAPRTRVEMRLMARTAFRRGDPLAGLFWQARYLSRKLLGRR